MTSILPLERRAAIAQRLADGLSVSAAALAAEFAVSEDAVRRDLRALAASAAAETDRPSASRWAMAARRSRGRIEVMHDHIMHNRA